jgi:hypothetical protein
MENYVVFQKRKRKAFSGKKKKIEKIFIDSRSVLQKLLK